jgi:choline-sulfatase
LRGAAALGAAAFGCPARSARPNLIWIVSDQHRFDVAGYMGDEHAHTPNLDRLASGSARLTAMYCQVPLCAPARQSLLTGQYAHSHATFRNGQEDYPRAIPTVAHALSAAGWRTALFGKTHCDTSGFGLVRDWQAMLAEFAAEHPGADRPGAEHYTFDMQDEDYDYAGMMNPQFLRAGPGPNFFMEEAVAREAAEFALGGAGPAQPFFIWASFVNPHPPLFPPDAFHDLYVGRDLPLRGRLDAPDPGWPAFVRERQAKQGRAEFESPDALLGITRAYYASLAWTDHCIGELLGALERAGLTENTIVVYTSDHGEMLGEHCLLKKMTFYEGAVRVPCLLRWPGRVGPRTVPRVLQHVDLAPTLLEALGVAAPKDARLAGRSLVPFLTGERDPDWAELAAAELLDRDRLHWMVRDERYKLVWHGAEDVALFDLVLDPGETRNLAGEGGQAARLDELRSRFDELTAGTDWNVGR